MAQQGSKKTDWVQTILDTTADGIITIDQHGIILPLNSSAEKTFGYLPSDVIGHNVSILAPSPYREEHDGYLARYLRTGEAHILGREHELEAQHRDGSKFPIALRVTETEYLGERVLWKLSRRLPSGSDANGSCKRN